MGVVSVVVCQLRRPAPTDIMRAPNIILEDSVRVLPASQLFTLAARRPPHFSSLSLQQQVRRSSLHFEGNKKKEGWRRS